MCLMFRGTNRRHALRKAGFDRTQSREIDPASLVGYSDDLNTDGVRTAFGRLLSFERCVSDKIKRPPLQSKCLAFSS